MPIKWHRPTKRWLRNMLPLHRQITWWELLYHWRAGSQSVCSDVFEL